MRRFVAIALFAVGSLAVNLSAPAAIDPTIDGIEEDWQIVINTPDVNLTCPQIQTIMRPDSSTPSSTMMVFNLNYSENPDFVAGGLQVKIQHGDTIRASATQGTGQLNTNNETITWTQRMSLSNGALNFKVSAGSSTTWGQFGVGASDLAVTSSTRRTSLTYYSPDDSVSNSGVGFGSNRLASMTLTAVRYYRGKTLVSTDNTDRTVTLGN